jgi:Mrp family chromosome partitioning ATPase/capsular polysaccharide biosynthesis protein
MTKQPPVSAQLELAPVIFPKPPSRGAEEGTVRSVHLLESLRRHKSLIGILLLVFLCASGFLIYRRRNPVYEASSRIRISPAAPKALTDDKAQIGPYDSLVEEQIKTVTRYDVLADALKQLPPADWAAYGPNENVAVNTLQNILKIARLGNSFDVEISLEGSQPRQVTDTVNAITSTYVDRARHEEYYERDQRLGILRDEETHLQSQLETKVAQQEQLLRDLGVGSVQASESSPYNENIGKLQKDLAQATEDLNAAVSNLTALQAGGANSPGMQAAAQEAAKTDPGVASLRTTLSAQRGMLVQQMAGLTPTNPVYKQDEEQIKTIDAQLAKATADTAASLTHRYQADIYQKRLVVAGLRRQLLEQTQLATGSAPRFQQAQQISSDINHLQTGYAQVEERMRELEVDSSAPGSIQLLMPARVPNGPKKTKTPLIAMILFLMSIGASVGAAVALDYFDPHIYGAEDIRQVMGFPPIGLLLDHDHFSAEVSQQYLLRLAAALHHAVRASGARTFLFTATEPEDGTTTMVEKVARQLRALNMRTLTIAATNVDGRITYVSTSPTPDAGRDPARDNLRDNGRPLNPAGTDKMEHTQGGPLALSLHVGEPANAMFSGSFVAQILSEHQDDYDVVLIDGGPLLISADAEYLARIADGTVVVTQSGRTKRAQLKRSAALLEKLHVPGVAVVLNRILPDRADAALRQDIEDFQQQLKKQRGAAATKSYIRRIPVSDRPFDKNDRPTEKNENGTTADQGEAAYKTASVS